MQLYKALVAQLSGLVLVAVLAKILPSLIYGMWWLALLQGVIAAALSRLLLGQPGWWVPIHLLFSSAALTMMALQLPSWLYLLAVLLLALVFWGTVKGDVPLFLSSPQVAEAIAAVVRQEQAASFVDLGAGVGSVVAPLARRQRQLAIEAWEHAPLPWAVLLWRCRRLSNVSVLRKSFWECDLSTFDVVFAFLSPLPMSQLGEKIRREMPSGSLFVSSSFPVPDWEPEAVHQIEDRRGTKLYCYRIK